MVNSAQEGRGQGERREEESEKEERKRKRKERKRLFGFSKFVFIPFSYFRIEILFLRNFGHVFYFYQLRC